MNHTTDPGPEMNYTYTPKSPDQNPTDYFIQVAKADGAHAISTAGDGAVAFHQVYAYLTNPSIGATLGDSLPPDTEV